jgi:hypothetical protein
MAALSQEHLKALEVKKAQLEEEYRKCHARLEEIQKDLVTIKGLIESPDLIKALLKPSGAPIASSNGHSDPYAEMGLREALRAVLREHPKGLKPKEVTERLVSGRFPTHGDRSKLGVRVSSELHRMTRAKTNPIRRLPGSGRYLLSDGG